MEILIDGKRRKYNVTTVNNLGTLLEIIYDDVRNEGRMVSKIILDSEEITPDREDTLEEAPIGDYTRLEIGTATRREIAKESIEDCLAYIDHLQGELREVVRGLRGDNLQKFGRRLMESLEDLTDFLELFASVKEMSSVDMTKIAVDGKTVDDIETLMLSAIKEVVSTDQGEGIDHVITSIEMILIPVLDLFKRCIHEFDRMMDEEE